MYTILTITRIVRTADPDQYRYIWSDCYEETHPGDWGGYFRGAVTTYRDGEEYERQTHVWEGGPSFADIMGNFIAGGGMVEDYVPPEPPAEPELASEE